MNALVLPWAFAGLALLFNPILPVYLSRSLWAPIDLGAAAFLLLNRRALLSTRP